MNKTFQNVIDTFETIVLSGNSVLKSFGFGLSGLVDNKEISYPSVYIDNLVNVHTYKPGEVEFIFDIWFYDTVNADLSNEKYVQSDMLQNCFDLINHLKDNSETYGFWINKNQGTSINFNFFTEVKDDKLAGVFSTVSVIVPDGGNECKNIFN